MADNSHKLKENQLRVTEKIIMKKRIVKPKFIYLISILIDSMEYIKISW